MCVICSLGANFGFCYSSLHQLQNTNYQLPQHFATAKFAGGAFWLKSELFLTKIRTLNFDCRASRGRAENFSVRAGREGKGVGGKGIPAPPSLPSASRASLIISCPLLS